MTMVIHSNEEGSICSSVIDGEEYVKDEATKYWNEPIRAKLYMETKKDVIEKRLKEVGDVHLDNYDDDGAYIHLVYDWKEMIRNSPFELNFGLI